MRKMLRRVVAIDCRLCILICDIVVNPNDRSGEAMAGHFPFSIDLHVANHRGAIFVLAQRTDISAKNLRQHRHHTVGKIDRIPALARFAIERTARTNIITDIGNRDDCLESPCSIRFGPYGVIVVACIRRIDRDNRNVTQILALRFAQRKFCSARRFIEHGFRKHMRNSVLGNRDEAETPRRQRIAHNLDNFHP